MTSSEPVYIGIIPPLEYFCGGFFLLVFHACMIEVGKSLEVDSMNGNSDKTKQAVSLRSINDLCVRNQDTACTI